VAPPTRRPPTPYPYRHVKGTPVHSKNAHQPASRPRPSTGTGTGTGTGTDTGATYCHWHRGDTVTGRLVALVEQATGPGAAYYACDLCRDTYHLTPL
jgi:hypothetical protein